MNSKTSESDERKSPGRPPKADADKAQQCSVYLTPESMGILTMIPGRTKSEKANWAFAFVAKHLKQEGGDGERASA